VKYKDRDELVEGLRAFADFIEERGLELPIQSPKMKLTEILYGENAKEKIQNVARKIGRAEKNWGSYYFDLRKEFGPVTLEFSVQKEQVCQKRVVGFKDVPEYISPARREEVVEWTCVDSILAS